MALALAVNARRNKVADHVVLHGEVGTLQASLSTESVFDPDADDLQIDSLSEAGKPGLGMACIGSRWPKKGNCGTLSIKGMAAVLHRVQLYCYSMALTEKPGAKPSAGVSGKCLVPFCFEDEQCRRGTYLQPCEKNRYTCQEVAQAYMNEKLPTTLPAATVAAMVLLVLDNYLVELGAAASSQKGLTLGCAIVNMVSHALGQQVMHAIQGMRWPNQDNARSAEWCHKSQGFEALVQRYRNSRVMHQSIPDRFRPVLSHYPQWRFMPQSCEPCTFELGIQGQGWFQHMGLIPSLPFLLYGIFPGRLQILKKLPWRERTVLPSQVRHSFCLEMLQDVVDLERLNFGTIPLRSRRHC
jgi:hypothetical protein